MEFSSVVSSAFALVAKKNAAASARVLNFKFHPLNLAKFYDYCKNLTPDGSKCKTQARLNLTQNLSVKAAQIAAKFYCKPASRAAKIKISF